MSNILFVGENLVSLAGVEAFYIRLPGMVRESYSDGKYLPNDFVTVVDVTENHLDFAIQKYLPNHSPRLRMSQNIISDIRVIVTDQLGAEVDLNGEHCSFSFVIEEAHE